MVVTSLAGSSDMGSACDSNRSVVCIGWQYSSMYTNSGPVAEGADASRVAEHKMHLKRVKRRMTAAIQTTRVKWAARCIDSACPREQVGKAVRVEEVVFLFQGGVSLLKEIPSGHTSY